MKLPVQNADACAYDLADRMEYIVSINNVITASHNLNLYIK